MTTPSLIDVEKQGIVGYEKAINYVADNPEKELISLPKKDSDKLLDPKFKNYLKLSTDHSQEMITIYSGIIKDANKVLAEIDKYNK